MSIRFSSTGLITGYDIHHKSYHNVYVDIQHSISEGYLCLERGREIREKLLLPEFLQRLSNNYQDQERCGREILAALSLPNKFRIHQIADKLNHRYLQRIREGEVRISPYGSEKYNSPAKMGEIKNYEYEKVKTNEEYGRFFRPITISDLTIRNNYEEIDDDIYYLLTS